MRLHPDSEAARNAPHIECRDKDGKTLDSVEVVNKDALPALIELWQSDAKVQHIALFTAPKHGRSVVSALWSRREDGTWKKVR